MDQLKYSLQRQMALAEEVGYLRQTLKLVAELPSGSQGAYGKFAEAQNLAKSALQWLEKRARDAERTHAA